MTPYRSALLELLFALISTTCAGQTPASRFEGFLSNVVATTDTAIDDVFAGSGMAETKPQALAAMKAQLKGLFPLYGKSLGFEKVSEKDISPSLKKLVYIQKFERTLVVWIGYYYRAKDEWVASNVTYGEEYPKIFNSYP
jgi:hypothetical protein